MIEYNISLILDTRDQFRLQSLSKTAHPFFRFELDASGEKLILLELLEASRDCTIDEALNHFMDECEALEIKGLTGSPSLKVEAYFSVSRVAALNFEVAPRTLARLAHLRAEFDLWVMPCE